MMKIIAFLENVGASAELRHASHEKMRIALDAEAIDPQAQVAILANDRFALAAIAESSVVAHGIITPGKEDDEDDEAPKRDDDEIIPVRVAAPAIA